MDYVPKMMRTSFLKSRSESALMCSVQLSGGIFEKFRGFFFLLGDEIHTRCAYFTTLPFAVLCGTAQPAMGKPGQITEFRNGN